MQGNQVFWLGTFVLVALVGLVSLYRLRVIRQRTAGGGPWVETTGTVVSTSVESTSGARGVKIYYVAVKYSYRVGIRNYLGTTSIYVASGGIGAAEQKAVAYEQGTTLPVHYNPKKPGESLTEYDLEENRGCNALAWFLLVAGAVGVVGVLLSVIF